MDAGIGLLPEEQRPRHAVGHSTCWRWDHCLQLSQTLGGGCERHVFQHGALVTSSRCGVLRRDSACMRAGWVLALFFANCAADGDPVCSAECSGAWRGSILLQMGLEMAVGNTPSSTSFLQAWPSLWECN
ncbi:unnamed protein product [Symbiodinium pilosum]|uniref:Uncharacterized protein n=1 Tax=Symbiodinium pilosum TaxID=2952 RepID=A0A812ITD8_SYMPI|nr:unnamed protein product [Symbiodinium pilosum]